MSQVKPIVVLKFGGTSVSNLDRWEQILAVVNLRLNQGFKVAIVHSAKSGVTNLLESFVESKDLKTFEEISKSIQALADELGVDNNNVCFNQQLLSLSKQKTLTVYDKAQVLSFGEAMTNNLAYAYLSKHLNIEQIDPKTLFLGRPDDDRSLDSRVLSAKCGIKSCQLNKECAVMPGFIAADEQGNTIVLGRGGSDTSAAYLAVALKAQRIEIWTDVHGIFSANPRVVPSARLIEKIGYEEAREIAASGGKVLHPRCILPAEENGIPIHIYNTQDAQSNGTIIQKGYESTSPRVRAINVRHKITLVSMDSMNMWHQAGFMGKIFTVYEKLGLSVDIVVTAQTNVTISLDTTENIISQPILDQLESDLSKFCKVTVYKNCSAVTLVGYRMRALLGQIAPIISNFSEQRIYLTSQSSNDLNTSIVLNEDQSDKLVIALHEDLITKNANQYGFGTTWENLMNKNQEKNHTTPSWWENDRSKLLKIAETQSPCYVYDQATIILQINNLKKLTSIDKMFFAMKSNPNSEVLRTIYSQGVGIEMVSPGEIERVKDSIDNMDKGDMLFTPNFAPVEEYKLAFDNGYHVTIDNKFILEQNPEVFANQSVILRLDPGHGEGHHKYVRTAGEQSKFGIHKSELIEIKNFCDENNITIKGLHSHSGSGILDHKNWQRVIKYLTDQISIFNDVTIINMGGGYGITENPHEKGLDMEKLDAIINGFKKQYPKIMFWMEPGRYLVANAGVLMAKVTQTKVKGNSGYIGLETGMNSLVRPALYGAWHNIVNLTRIDEPKDITATIVGPICETGDVLGTDRKVPFSLAGDVFLIANSGAYGYAMASRYNLREPAQEIFVKS